ncbi:hypothetical protein LUZ61_009869 [Rhynchospora tenuis]|uniref:Glyoxylate/hydroxypyruvate reductase HPR3-like n=1 Tax=Rhynchospora tenuis TaxID=198213 RepID=A0AAD6EYU2_9POAL|nr:hypothetical protein LUZ61_009869 [Rhynchospora tenuis]
MATATCTTNTPKIGEKPKLLVLRRISAYFEGVFSPHFDLIKAEESSLPLPAFLSTHCRDIRAVLIAAPYGMFGSSLLDQLPSLGIVACTTAGVNHIDVDACRKRGIAVTNAGEMFTPDAADFAVGLLVDVLRKVTMADRYVRNGLWMLKGDYPLGSKVSGKRVGIVGLGSIGSHVAKRLVAFGCPISYFSRAPKPNYPSYRYFPNVLELARESDVLILSCALTDETRNIINRDVMVALGKDGVIINVGRGALIDEPELVRCLKEGVIGGAGLDVFVNEPEVPEELTHMDNVVLSDHRAVTTPEAFKGVLELAIANLDAFFSGKPLLSPVSC